MTSPTVQTKLQEQLDEFKQGRAKSNPEMFALRQEETAKLIATGIEDHSLHAGERAPDFTLPDARGGDVTLSTLLNNGPVVLTFYRGDWCPYCNLTLRAYQSILPELTARHATLVAISPQLPEFGLAMITKADLTFPVLSDVGNQVARRYHLLFTLPESLRPYSASITQSNGDESWELPMPATFVIQPDGIVRLAFTPADYTKRLDPDAILQALQ